MNERKLIASIRRCCNGDINMGNGIIKELKELARTDESNFINAMLLMTAPGGHIQVNFLVSKYALEQYHDFIIDDEGLSGAIVYAHKKHECLEEPKPIEELKKETDRIKKELADINSGDTFKKICESFACIGKTNVEASDINNDEKDFEYICDRCGVRVKTPNTLRGPVNVVDFYREVEDEVSDSVSYKLCQECMQDFFGFLSCNS